MTEKNKFIDFITDELKLITWNERKDGGDVVISKRFTRRKKEYTLIARFNNGDYIGGVLTDDQTAIIDGREFSLDFLLQLTREELKGA